MARYDHLPIFADAYRLALRVEQLVGELSNRVRPALGRFSEREMKEEAGMAAIERGEMDLFDSDDVMEQLRRKHGLKNIDPGFLPASWNFRLGVGSLPYNALLQVTEINMKCLEVHHGCHTL